MRNFYLLSVLTTLLIPVLLSCSEQVTGPEQKGALDRELTQAEKQLVEKGGAFSYNVFKQTIEEDSTAENVFISPLSISIALGMTMNGAEGETFEQMRETLAFNGLSQDEINEGYQSLAKLLREADPKVQMQIANSVWSREGFNVEEAFKQTVEKYFEAEVSSLDFDDPNAKDVINEWVSKNTNELIEEIIKGQIPSEMVMYLINAIYFKGNWTYQFDEKETRKSMFRTGTGEQVEVDMMRQENSFNILMNEEVHMIDLPYGDSLFTMTVMMPGDSETSLKEFIQNDLSQQQVSAWYDELNYREMPIRLPKFKMEYEITMNKLLYAMGMEDAFTRGVANFSKISPSAPLFISEVKHKTFVEVNEEGTEAAAVTSVGVGVTSMPQVFNVNRPFVFMIREQNSGAILFVGKVENPSI